MALEVDGRPLEGEFLRSAKLVNKMIDQLSVFTSEVTRVAREVGTEGKLGGQAQVKGVSGVWKDLTESVNQMAGNLTAQVRNIADVTIAVANGDLSKKITVDVRGEILQLKEAINTMVDQLRSLRRRSDARGARGRHRGQARRPGGGARRRRHLEGPHRLGQRDGVEPDGAGAQHRRRDDGRRARRPVAQDHGRRQGRDPRAEGHHQHDGRSAQRVRLGSEPRRARSRHRRQARRPGRSARRRRHVEGPHRLRQLDGREPHGAGPQHRRGDDRRRARRPLAQDHRRREGRDPRAEGHHQHDGRSAQRLRLGSDARGARGRHRRQARRPGGGARRRRHVEGPHRLRQLDGVEPHRPGAQHRRRGHGRRARRPVAQDHGRREGRDPRAEEHHQHDGRSAERVRLGSEPRRARSRHRRQARRPGGGARRRRHVEGPHRQRQLDGVEPDRPGAQHRRRGDRHRQRRPVAQDHGRREGRDPRAEEHHQHDGRSAQRASPRK